MSSTVKSRSEHNVQRLAFYAGINPPCALVLVVVVVR